MLRMLQARVREQEAGLTLRDDIASDRTEIVLGAPPQPNHYKKLFAQKCLGAIGV